MPQTVPNRPTKGAVAPIVARMPVPREIFRPAAISIRSACQAMRSFKPSARKLAESRIAFAGSLHELRYRTPAAAQFFTRLRQCARPVSTRRPRRTTARAPKSSMLLATQTVQVTSEATASPIITALTI